MRIIHLINHCRFGHGNVHAAVDLACAQVKRGEEVWIASGDGEFVPFLAGCGISHILLDQERRRVLDVLKMLYKLVLISTKIKPDIFHAHMMTGAVIGFIVSRFSSIKLITTVHNAFDKHSIIMALGDRVIAVSAAVSTLLKSRGVPAKKICIVLNGTLGAPRRDFFAKQTIILKRPNITTLCGLHDRKGVRDLLAAFSIVCEKDASATLYIAGDGPQRQAYEELAIANTKSSDRVHFLGEIRDTKSLLSASDIFILASHADPMPLVIFEAREANCAIVATNVDGIPEALEFGKAGVLVPAKCPESMAQALLTLLQNPQKQAQWKEAAGSDLDRWTIDRVARDTMAAYEDLIMQK